MSEHMHTQIHANIPVSLFHQLQALWQELFSLTLKTDSLLWDFQIGSWNRNTRNHWTLQ